MKYQQIQEGIFLQRINRFVAIVLVEGQEETVHVKNTGRCRELLIPGTRVILEVSDNAKRKTKFSLICVYKGTMLVNMDSQVPNAVAFEGIQSGKIAEIGTVDFIKREVTYSKSRFDIYFEQGSIKGFLEVKGVTLENAGVASFPDAPTERGAKHVKELMQAKKEGYYAGILFLIQMQGPNQFHPNDINDPKFSRVLREAAEKGVEVLCYDCIVEEEDIVIGKKIAVNLGAVQ